jgi:MFS family permease
MQKKPTRAVERAMYLTVMEAFFAGIMMNLVTGVLLVKVALELGASSFEIGILAAFPFITQLAQIPSIYLVGKVRKRKLVTLMGSVTYRLALFGLIFVPWLENKELSLMCLIGLVFMQNLGGGFSTGPWNGWMRDLIPQRLLGRVFGKRMNWYTLTGTIAAIIAAIVLDIMTGKDGAYTMPTISAFFTIAFIMSLISFSYLVRMKEAPIRMLPEHSMWQEFLAPLKDPNFRRLITFLLAILFAMNLAVPFFPVYMLDTLQLPVSYVTGLWALGQLMQVPFFTFWGNIADRFSHTTSLASCLPFFVLGLLLWPLTTLPEQHWLTLPLLVLIHLLLGVGLAGVLLSSQVIVLKLAPKKSAASYMATSTMLASMAAGVAAILGGWLAGKLQNVGVSIAVNVSVEETVNSLPAYHLQGYDFLFVGAAILIVLVSPLLAGVVEKGSVPKNVVMKLMRNKALDMVRGASTVTGIRSWSSYPLVKITRRKKGKYMEEAYEPHLDQP